MKPAAREVLKAAAEHHRRIADGDGTIAEKDHASWFRPREIGGSASNRYGTYLLQLVKRRLIERRDGAPGSWRECRLFEYRITEAGLEELRDEQPEHRGGWYGSRCHGQ